LQLVGTIAVLYTAIRYGVSFIGLSDLIPWSETNLQTLQTVESVYFAPVRIAFAVFFAPLVNKLVPTLSQIQIQRYITGNTPSTTTHPDIDTYKPTVIDRYGASFIVILLYSSAFFLGIIILSDLFKGNLSIPNENTTLPIPVPTSSPAQQANLTFEHLRKNPKLDETFKNRPNSSQVNTLLISLGTFPFVFSIAPLIAMWLPRFKRAIPK
jgi:hypothetical protein